MISVTTDKCKGCGICVKNCPVAAIKVTDKKAKIQPSCVSCGVCVRVCTFQALEKRIVPEEGHTFCTHCSVRCNIPQGAVGACTRYTNVNGEIKRNRNLVLDAPASLNPFEKLPDRPLTTAVGAGTSYPCCRPAPYIVEAPHQEVDVVTVVTEAPLSYSGVKVKIDTNTYIGEEGAKVKRDGKVIGMVTTEEYGSKMLTIGGANLLSHGNDGFIVARTIVDLANGRRVTVKVDGGSTLELQQGYPPVIDGVEQRLMRVGCGSATVGMFPRQLAAAADECIVLDYHIIGLLTEHFAGEEIGLQYSGVVPNGVKSTRGRYFGEMGRGWGGTNIESPVDAVASVDMRVGHAGMKIMVTETTGTRAALLEVQADGSVSELPLTREVSEAAQLIRDTCEPSLVSVIYTGGTGGSARAGVTTSPRKLTEAVHREEVRMSVGGAPVFVLPGGGINFMVDVSKMVSDAVTWVPTPATVAPVEYTMTKETYLRLGGHKANIVTKEELLRQLTKNQ